MNTVEIQEFDDIEETRLESVHHKVKQTVEEKLKSILQKLNIIENIIKNRK